MLFRSQGLSPPESAGVRWSLAESAGIRRSRWGSVQSSWLLKSLLNSIIKGMYIVFQLYLPGRSKLLLGKRHMLRLCCYVSQLSWHCVSSIYLINIKSISWSIAFRIQLELALLSTSDFELKHGASEPD